MDIHYRGCGVCDMVSVLSVSVYLTNQMCVEVDHVQVEICAKIVAGAASMFPGECGSVVY